MIKKKKKKKKKGWGDQIFASDLVSIEKITADGKMQQRVQKDEQAISEYQRILANGGELPAIKCVNDSTGALWLWDGFHTLEAAKQAGLSQIRVEISEGTKRDAWLKSLGANAKHGIRRSLADKQNTVDNALSDPEIKMSLLEEDGLYSFRKVAKLCAVAHQTVWRRWEKFHYLKILEDIDEAVRVLALPDLINNKERFAQIAAELGVPAWLVEKRILIRSELAEAKKANEAELTGAPFSTHQTTDTEKYDQAEVEKTNGTELTGGPFSTHQTVDAQNEDQAEVEKTNGTELTGSPFSTHQTVGAQNEDQAEAEKANGAELTGGPFSTHQIVDAQKGDQAEAEKANGAELTGGPFSTHQTMNAQIAAPEFIAGMAIHYKSKQISVKDALAQRPDEGWAGEIGQEIDRALSAVGGGEVEGVRLMLVVMAKD